MIKPIRKKRLSLIAALLLGLAAMAFGIGFLVQPLFPGRESGSPAIYRVKRTDLVVRVLESGNLKARESLEIRSEVEGRTTIISIVKEGTLITREDVKNGKILIELDSADLQDKAIQQEISVNNARSEFQQAQENLEIQLKQNESDIQAGELKLRFSMMDLEKYLGAGLAQTVLGSREASYGPLIGNNRLEGEALQRKRILESDINLALEEVSRAQNKLNWTEELQSKGYVTRDELEADRLSLKRRKVELERAQTALDLFVTYDFPKETERLVSGNREALRELDRVTARARSKESQVRADYTSRKLIFNLQTDKLQKLKRQIEKCTIRATRPGLVVYAQESTSWRSRQEPIEEGATVRERQPLIRLPDLSVLAVDVKVIESAVKKVKPGQQALIRLEAFPDLKLAGTVGSVAVVPDSQVSWINPDLKVYTTEVVIDGEYPLMKPGLTAKVEIIVDRLSDVITVPIQAVHPHRDRSVCYVKKMGYYEARAVEIGAASESVIQIIKGIEEGEEVLLRAPGPGERVVYGS